VALFKRAEIAIEGVELFKGKTSPLNMEALQRLLIIVLIRLLS
jgi:hypothetical protein